MAEAETLRVFAGRDSSGVRGIRLLGDDQVISLVVLNHINASVDERAAYLKYAAARRRAGDEAEAAAEESAEEGVVDITLTPERISELEAAERFILTITDGGFGKRSSAYHYRVTGRGGQGITNIGFSARTGRSVVASFIVGTGDDVMLVTDGGRLIRLPAGQVNTTGRQGMGVKMMGLRENEYITSCFPVLDDGEDEVSDA